MSENLAKAFIDIFNPEANGFTNPVQLEDRKIGFSVQKKYDETLLKRLRVNKNEPFVCMIWVVVKDDDYEKTDLIPIKLRASFGYKRDGMIYKATDYLPKRQWWLKLFYPPPLDVESKDEFFFDKASEKFFFKHKEIAPNVVLDAIFNMHIKITKPLKGLWLRIKYFLLIIFMPFIYKSSKMLCKSLYFIIALGKYDYDIFQKQFFLDSQEPEEETKASIDNEKTIEVLGYPIKQKPLFTYSFFTLAVFTANYFLPSLFTNFIPIHNYIVTILKNSFLTILYAIVTLYLWEFILPSSLKYGVKYFEEKSFASKFHKITI